MCVAVKTLHSKYTIICSFLTKLPRAILCPNLFEDFGVTRSKVKITVTFNVKMVSADYIENHLSKSLHILLVNWSILEDDSY